MKILYGIQGTGNGHISRSREMVKELKKNNDVHCVLSGRNKNNYFDIEDFKPYDIYKGLTFHKKDGKIDFAETLMNIDILSFIKDIKKVSGKFDLVITDFEPITSIFARKNGIPSVGISHQYSFNISKFLSNDIDPLFKYIIKNFAPADKEIGLHWMSFEENIMHPILSKEILTMNTFEENFYIVYLPWESKEKIKSLSKFGDNFVVYDKREIHSKNIKHKKLSKENFLKDLSKCKGVICNSGFQLLTEAIYFNKKIFTIPMRNQSEQISNANILNSMSLGQVGNLETKEDFIIFENWLRRDLKPNYLFETDTKEKLVNIISQYK
jgi:uncharacterized protein (TIGR00661 family)